MAKRKDYLSINELRVFVQIGYLAGQITFGSLILVLIPLDTNKLGLVVLFSIFTFVLWGLSWFLTRKYKL